MSQGIQCTRRREDSWSRRCIATVGGTSVIEQQSWEVKHRISSPSLSLTRLIGDAGVTAPGSLPCPQVGRREPPFPSSPSDQVRGKSFGWALGCLQHPSEDLLISPFNKEPFIIWCGFLPVCPHAYLLSNACNTGYPCKAVTDVKFDF